MWITNESVPCFLRFWRRLSKSLVLDARCGTLNICDIWNGSFLVLYDEMIFSNNSTNNYIPDLFF